MTTSDSPSWPVLSDRELFKNPVLRLHQERLFREGAGEIDWTMVDVGDGVAVLPIEEDGTVHLIQQYRPTVARRLWELPAGRCETGESPEDAGRRELREEAGLLAERMEPLVSLVPLAGISRHVVHLYAARGLSSVETALEPFEEIVVQRLAPERWRSLIREGSIDCGITLSALSHLLIQDGEPRE